MEEFLAQKMGKNDKYVVFKTGSVEHRIKMKILKQHPDTFFSGLCHFIESTDEYNDTNEFDIPVEDDPEVFKIIVKYLEYGVYDRFVMLDFIKIAELEKAADFYCLEELEKLVFEHKQRRLKKLFQRIHIPIARKEFETNVNIHNVGGGGDDLVITNDTENALLTSKRFRLKYSYKCNSSAPMIIKQEATKTPTGSYDKMEIYLQCKGRSFDNSGFTFNIDKIIVRDNYGKIVNRFINKTLWEGLSYIKIAEITREQLSEKRWQTLKLYMEYNENAYV